MNALTLYRLAHRLYRLHVPFLPRIIQKVNFTMTRCVVPYQCEMGDGTELAYGGIGTVIHPKAILGRRVMVGPCVTIGGRSGLPGAPTIEDDVMIGSGAQVLGPITIGCGATIGAGSVVIHDVAAHTKVAGVPAKTLKFKTHRFNEALLHGKPITPQLSGNLKDLPVPR